MTSKKAPLSKAKRVQGALARSRQRTVDARPSTLRTAPKGYATWIHELKTAVYEARQRAARSVNQELVALYWRIGHDIRVHQKTQGWGAKIVDRISADLKMEFPDSEGFSPRNLKYMRAFAAAWPDEAFVQGVLAQLPWYTHLRGDMAGDFQGWSDCKLGDVLESQKGYDHPSHRRQPGSSSGPSGFHSAPLVQALGGLTSHGRYVGAEEVEDVGEPFYEKMKRLVSTLEEPFDEGVRREKEIRNNLRGLDYGG